MKKYIIVKNHNHSSEADIKSLIKTYYKNTLESAKKYNNNQIINIIKTELNKLDTPNTNQLGIELNYKDIKDYYEKYKIIVLKKPFAEYMYLNPKTNNNDGFIRVSLDLDSNPTIIGCFGLDEGLIKLYSDAEFWFLGLFYDSDYKLSSSRTNTDQLPLVYKTFFGIFRGDFGSFQIDKEKKIIYNGSGLKKITLFL